MLSLWKQSYDQCRQHIKKQKHYFACKVPSSQGYGFSSSHIWMWELDYKESWAPNNWCFWTVVLEKTLESPLDCKEIQLVLAKGISPGYSLEGLMLKLRLQYFGHLMQSADSERPWWERLRAGGKGTTEVEMVCWHHRLSGTWVWVNSRSWWWTGRPACCSSWGHKESDTTGVTELKWTDTKV